MGPDHQEYYQNNILTGFIVKIEGYCGELFMILVCKVGSVMFVPIIGT